MTYTWTWWRYSEVTNTTIDGTNTVTHSCTDDALNVEAQRQVIWVWLILLSLSRTTNYYHKRKSCCIYLGMTVKSSHNNTTVMAQTRSLKLVRMMLKFNRKRYLPRRWPIPLLSGLPTTITNENVVYLGMDSEESPVIIQQWMAQTRSLKLVRMMLKPTRKRYLPRWCDWSRYHPDYQLFTNEKVVVTGMTVMSLLLIINSGWHKHGHSNLFGWCWN